MSLTIEKEVVIAFGVLGVLVVGVLIWTAIDLWRYRG